MESNAEIQAKLTKVLASISVKDKFDEFDRAVLKEIINQVEEDYTVIPIDLPIDVIATLAVAAHEEHMSLNDFLIIKISEYCKDILNME